MPGRTAPGEDTAQENAWSSRNAGSSGVNERVTGAGPGRRPRCPGGCPCQGKPLGPHNRGGHGGLAPRATWVAEEEPEATAGRTNWGASVILRWETRVVNSGFLKTILKTSFAGGPGADVRGGG